MLRTVWARFEERRRLYLIDERCEFVEPVKLYLDHLAALEKSPHTLENYCRDLALYFRFLSVSKSTGAASDLTTWSTSSSGYEIAPGGMKAT